MYFSIGHFTFHIICPVENILRWKLCSVVLFIAIINAVIASSEEKLCSDIKALAEEGIACSAAGVSGRLQSGLWPPNFLRLSFRDHRVRSFTVYSLIFQCRNFLLGAEEKKSLLVKGSLAGEFLSFAQPRGTRGDNVPWIVAPPSFHLHLSQQQWSRHSTTSNHC